MLAGSHRNAWPDETGTGGRTNRNTQMYACFPRCYKFEPKMKIKAPHMH